MKRKIRVGSRDSKLAVMQTELVMDAIRRANPQIDLELVTLKTTGDLILDKTLDQIGGKGLFVKELDQALADGRIDLAVHSLKDMPMETNEELPIVACAKRGDPRDVLVLPKGAKPGSYYLAKVGSSSPRRQLQLQILYPIIHLESVRGNIMTRLKKLDGGEYSALVLAAAGLQRAGLQDRIYKYFSTDEMIPAAGQGILAVQARKDLDAAFLAPVNDPSTVLAATAERSFVRTLDGGCSSPIAAHAVIQDGEMKLNGLYYREETQEYRTGGICGPAERAEKLGEELALRLKEELGG